MTDLALPLSRKALREQPAKFRIEAIISDGMWYTITKWMKASKVSEEELMEWIDAHLKDGSLIQSPASAGSKSYRMPKEAIYQWYKEQGIEVGEQLLDFVFPPRIWDGLTEVDGFESAPLREIGLVSFSCSDATFQEVKRRLKGVARIREEIPRSYKAYCLSAPYVKDIIQQVYDELGETNNTLRARSKSKRREMVDLTPEFSKNFVLFYKKFGKSLVKGHQETINIYLPDTFDQESQMIVWVIEALEKFDESAAVPFSGYFNNVMGRWPYNLPMLHLGPELSEFQLERARAIKRLNGGDKNSTKVFSNKEIANEMGWDFSKFSDLEFKHRLWMKARNATTMTWDESSDERLAISSVMGGESLGGKVETQDINLAARLSRGLLKAALDTGKYEDALAVISQLDANSVDFQILANLDEKFVSSLGKELEV